MFHPDFQLVLDAAKNAKDPLVRSDQEWLEVHMAIEIEGRRVAKAAQVTDVMQTRLTEVDTAPSLLMVSSQSCSFSILVNAHLRS